MQQDINISGKEVQLTKEVYRYPKGTKGIATYDSKYNHGVSVILPDNTDEVNNGNPYKWFFIWRDIELVEDINQEIEVGDIIQGNISGRIERVTKITSNFYYYGSTDDNRIGKDLATLISKANKQEVIVYELLKDLPGIPAGTKNNGRAKEGNYNFSSAGNTLIFTSKDVQDTTWFKPIYKAKEVVVKISGDREVAIKDNKIMLDSKEGVSLDQFKNIRSFFTEKRTTNTWAMNYPLVVTQIKIGCQLVNGEDVELIHQAIQNLK